MWGSANWALPGFRISRARRHDGGYELCVSTLESRKNHLLLFQAWDMMIARHGLEATPYLICVGKSGWLFDAPQAFLKSRPHLAERVTFLASIDDVSLAALYARAKFTVYPSFFEGWGLPVTEALCFGKATACSNASSLPEAGGAFVEYFDPFAPREAFEVIDRLAFDDAHRKALEDTIARSYRARTWTQIAAQALDAVSAIVNRDAGADEIVAPPPVEWNKLYFMTPRTSGTREVARSAEDIRLGGGWHRCAAWGAWTRTRRAMLRFNLAEPPMGAIALYIQLKGAVEGPLILTQGLPRISFGALWAPGDLTLTVDNHRPGPVRYKCRSDDRSLVEGTLHYGENRLLFEGVGSNGRIEITSETWIPNDEIRNGDTRPIGFHIRGVCWRLHGPF